MPDDTITPPPVGHRPDRLLWLLGLLVVLGVAGTGASVVTARQVDAATKQDVQRTQDLVARVATLQREAQEYQEDAQAVGFAARERAEQRHQEVCRIILDVATAARIRVDPCTAVPPVPAPTG